MTAQPHTRQFLPALNRQAAHFFNPLQREIDRVFEDFGRGWGAFSEDEVNPRTNVAMTDEGVEVTMELPGMAREDVKITVDDDVLTVSGEKKAEKTETKQDYKLVERTFGSFTRSVGLPRGADVTKITATMADGVLTVKAPKPAGAESRTIEIKTV